LALAVLIGGGYLIYRAIGPVDEIDGRDDRPVAQRSPAATSDEEEPGNAEPNSTPTGVGEESRATATAQRQATLRAHTPQAESVPTPLRPANVSQSGEGVTVALVGTGVDNSHPDLSTRVLAEQDFTRTGTADVTGHDTVLAGIVAGSGRASDGHFVGVAPGARLYVARVIGDNGAGSESDLLAGLRWAVDQ